MDRLMLHCSGFGENFGDILISQYMMEHLHSWFPETEIVSIGLDPRFCAHLGLKSISAPEAVDTVGAWVLGPGGYLSQPDSKLFRWHLRNYRRHKDALQAFASGTGAKAVFGASIGPLWPLSPLAARVDEVLDVSDFVAVRDEVSREYCEIRMTGKPPAAVIPDVAFDSDWLRARGTSECGSNTRKPLVVLHGETEMEFICLIRALGRAADQGVFDREGSSLLLLSDNAAISVGHSWKKGLVASAKSHGFDEVMLVDFLSVGQLIGSLATAALVVSTKLHVGLSALSLGVPVLFAAKHPKVRRLLGVVDAQDLVVPLDAGALTSRIIGVLHGLESQDQRIASPDSDIKGALTHLYEVIRDRGV